MIKLVEHEAVKKWRRENAFNPAKVILYGFRHSYITRMLGQGVPIKVLADWCGASVVMLERAYAHIHDDLRAMRALFLQFSSGAGEPRS